MPVADSGASVGRLKGLPSDALGFFENHKKAFTNINPVCYIKSRKTTH